jgi:hypothetical protein
MSGRFFRLDLSVRMIRRQDALTVVRGASPSPATVFVYLDLSCEFLNLRVYLVSFLSMANILAESSTYDDTLPSTMKPEGRIMIRLKVRLADR